jgi:hypothetical protein
LCGRTNSPIQRLIFAFITMLNHEIGVTNFVMVKHTVVRCNLGCNWTYDPFLLVYEVSLQ